MLLLSNDLIKIKIFRKFINVLNIFENIKTLVRVRNKWYFQMKEHLKSNEA
jgi:hypothetical protein